jgi:hypothetical protein
MLPGIIHQVCLEHKAAQFNHHFGNTGSYVTEESAARAHDLAALKYWGISQHTKLNFNVRTVLQFFVYCEGLLYKQVESITHNSSPGF